MKYLYLILLISFLFLEKQSAQERTFVDSIGYSGMSFQEFRGELKEKTDYSIYARPEWLASIQLKTAYINKDVKYILEDIFKGYGLEFLLREKQIILTRYVNLESSFNYGLKVRGTNSTKEISQIDLSELKELEYKIHRIGALGTEEHALFKGKLKDAESQEPIIGAQVYLDDLSKGVVSNAQGEFSLQMRPDKYTVYFKHVAYDETYRQIDLRSSGSLNVNMIRSYSEIDEIQITAQKSRLQRNEMGIEKLDSKTIKAIPVVMGEPDIVKVTTILPGVESAGEGSIGYNVRGGSADQNLMLIDGAPVYYPAHFFGFYSAFDSDMIQDATLYKSSIPVEYGGRIASVYDIKTHENNCDKFGGKLGLSPVAAKFSNQFPLLKGKLKWFNSGRITYSDWLINKINTSELINSSADFGDIHSKINYEVNEKNSIHAAIYMSDDNFKLHSDSTYRFRNLLGSVNWQARLSENLKLRTQVYRTSFNFDLSTDAIPENAFNLNHKLIESGADMLVMKQGDFIKESRMGVQLKNYRVTPAKLRPNSDASNVGDFALAEEQAIELALYYGVEFSIAERLHIQAGLRYGMYGNIGQQEDFIYGSDYYSTKNIKDTLYSSGLNNIRHAPEYRLSLNYKLSTKDAIKFSFNRNRQNVHLLSNSTSISPTDTWKLSDSYLLPQDGLQYSLGYYKDVNSGSIELSVETYYKQIENIKDYKDAAELFFNDHIETEVVNAEGKSYGLEFYLKKASGRFQTSVSYTYSRSFIKANSEYNEFRINDGDYYPSAFDKPHSLKGLFMFHLSRRFILSVNTVYHTGRPTTYPISKFQFAGEDILYYSDRNEYRLPDYFRTDLSIQMEGNLKKDKLFHTMYSFGIYNLTGRNNAYSVYFRQEEKSLIGYKLAIFGQAIPTFTYTIKF